MILFFVLLCVFRMILFLTPVSIFALRKKIQLNITLAKHALWWELTWWGDQGWFGFTGVCPQRVTPPFCASVSSSVKNEGSVLSQVMGIKWVCVQFYLFIYLFIFYFWPRRGACGISVPQPGTEPRPLAVKERSPNHWTARVFSFRTDRSHTVFNCFVLFYLFFGCAGS